MGTTQRIDEISLEPVYPPEIKIPTEIELIDIFNQFLMNRIGLPFHRLVMKETPVIPLLEEWELLFLKPMLGILVMRTTPEFEVLTGEQITGKNPRERKPDVLETLVVLFWHHLASTYWGLETIKLRTALIQKSGTNYWPKRNSTVVCGAIVLDQPLEMRMWIPVSENEIRIR